MINGWRNNEEMNQYKQGYEQGKQDALSPEIFDLWVKGKVRDALNDAVKRVEALHKPWARAYMDTEVIDAINKGKP